MLVCESCAVRVSDKFRDAERSIGERGVVQTGRLVAALPQVEHLESDCSSFLIEANRAIKSISALPALFITLPRVDSNFDHLRKHLADAVGQEEPITKFVESAASEIRWLVEMRNLIEHPTQRKTVIKNFHVLPDGQISSPKWYLEGEAPEPIAEGMQSVVDFLIQVAENMIILLIMQSGKERFTYKVQQIPDNEINRNFPIKYKLSAFFRSPPTGSSNAL